MGYYNFRKDLEVSHGSVKRVCDVIKNNGGEIIDIGDTKDYDIRFLKNGKEYLMEVKEDLMSSKTGNVAIEYFSRGKPSGILSSKASLWCYIINDIVYFTTKTKILGLIENKKYSKCVEGGDRKTSLLYLIPQKTFLEICKS